MPRNHKREPKSVFVRRETSYLGEAPQMLGLYFRLVARSR